MKTFYALFFLLLLVGPFSTVRGQNNADLLQKEKAETEALRKAEELKLKEEAAKKLVKEVVPQTNRYTIQLLSLSKFSQERLATQASLMNQQSSKKNRRYQLIFCKHTIEIALLLSCLRVEILIQ